MKENILLAPYTSFGIGGAAKYFLEAKSEKEIKDGLAWAKRNNIQVFVLGGGTNILVSDNGFDGVVIKLENSLLQFSGSQAFCGAGVLLEQLVRKCIERGLGGVEYLSGIGGTVGGAVRGNAGAFGQTIGEAVKEVKAFLNGEIKSFSHEDSAFQYRQSIFKEIPSVISSITFEFHPAKKEELKKKSQEVIAKRNSRYNIHWQCAGCIFKNIDLREITIDKERVLKALDITEKEYSEVTKFQKLPVSFIVDKLGLKGKKIGGAKIAEEHGAFIINAGGAKAEDIVALMSLIKLKVRNALGIQLEEEVQLVGF